ncbi:hypothetical protein YC2023_023659 [Brassica napus]
MWDLLSNNLAFFIPSRGQKFFVGRFRSMFYNRLGDVYGACRHRLIHFGQAMDVPN